MSTEIVDIIRAIVRDELSGLSLGDIAVVTGGFPHADAGDANNYECTVKLRESGLELPRVPMATPHIGMASAPQPGELVLVSYVGGDPNRPVVVGRLYSDTVRPPVHDAGEWRVQAPAAGTTSIAIDKGQAVVVTAGKTVVTVHKDGNVEIAGEQDIAITVKGNATISCTDCTLDASGTIDLGTGGGGVITEKSHKCYFSGAPLMGSASVRAKG